MSLLVVRDNAGVVVEDGGCGGCGGGGESTIQCVWKNLKMYGGMTHGV